MDLANLTPEALVIGGLLHLHARMNRVETDLSAIAAKLHIPNIRSKVTKKGALSLWLLPLTCLLSLSVACSSLDQLTDHQKAAGKAIAKIALQLAIGELNGRVKELQPYTPNLTKLLDITFAKPLTPEEAAREVKTAVAETIPAPHHAEVLASMRHALTREGDTPVPESAAGASQPTYRARLAAAL